MNKEPIFSDEAVTLSFEEVQALIDTMPKPIKEWTLSDGTKVSEYRSGAIVVQTAYHEDDGWNWQMKDESK